MTVCKKCNGTGEIIVPVVGTMLYGKQQCDECNGTGEIEVEMTNEEWLKSLDTEELAKWLHTAIFDDALANKMADESYMNMQTRDDYIENWLMEKHYAKRM